MRGAGEDAVTEARCEAFDLGLDTVGHVDGRAGRHVAVRPGNSLTVGRARGIPGLVLDEKDVRPLRDAVGGHIGLRGGDLLERAAEVDSRGSPRTVRCPRHGAVERPIDLEDTRPVTKLLRSATDPRGESIAGDVE